MLFILPCAGGSAANYVGYNRFFDKVYAYEYPGHWTRYSEPLNSDPDYMIGSLLDRIIGGKWENGINILGHSMGGLLAWRLVNELLSRGIVTDHLYLAACGVPENIPKILHEVKSDDDIKCVLRKIRQIPENILESDFFGRNLLPMIRNDFDVVMNITDCRDLYKDAKIPVDITCLYGSDDPVIDNSDMYGWRKHTKTGFNIRELKGDHFFLYKTENISVISDLI